MTNILETMDLITKSLSECFSVDYLDFLKAFDMVLHWKMIQKLRSYSIIENLLKWIQSFLSEHSQRVDLGHVASS